MNLYAVLYVIADEPHLEHIAADTVGEAFSNIALALESGGWPDPQTLIRSVTYVGSAN